MVQAQQVWSPVYVDALILRDRNADGNNTNGPSGDGLEQRHYVAQDANFNVTALIGATTGAVVERYYYQAYGVPTVLDANFVPRVNGQSQFAWRYLHQGGRFDWAAGYYHFRNRDLSPTLGRWLNHDPIGFEGSKWNLYEYVEGRPTVGLDPSGEKYVPCVIAISCLAIPIATCTAMCSQDHWDNLCDSFGDCLGKCLGAVFGPDLGNTNAGGIYSGICTASIGACGLEFMIRHILPSAGGGSLAWPEAAQRGLRSHRNWLE